MLKTKINLEGELTASHLIREAAEQSLNIALTPETRSNTALPFGSGTVFTQELQPGLRCEMHSLQCHRDTDFECSAEPQVSCSITLEGHLEGIRLKGCRQVENPVNRAVLMGFGEPVNWIRTIQAGQYFKAFSITMQPDFIDRFTDDLEDTQLAALAPFRQGFKAEILPHSQRLIRLAHRAFEHSYSGALATLFQESNSLQFIVEAVQLLREENQLAEQIGQAHYDRLMQARAILDRSLLSPPSTLELAREVGTNITTLQTHFKLALDTTIFGYVKTQRLEMARVLLTEHNLPVAETAHRVGFNSPSAFTASYRRYFGHPPTAEMS